MVTVRFESLPPKMMLLAGTRPGLDDVAPTMSEPADVSGSSPSVAIRMAMTVGLGFSPYLWMNDLDNHEMRQLDFSGTLSGGLLLDPSLQLSWRVTPRARLAVDLSYRIIWGLVGNTRVTGTGVEGSTGPELNPGVSVLYSDSSGTSFGALGASVSLVLTL